MTTFSERVCLLLSDLKRNALSKNEGISKWNELLEFVSSTETIEIFEEMTTSGLFDDENTQLINLKLIGNIQSDDIKILLSKVFQSIEEEFGLSLNQIAFPNFEETYKEVETYLNLLKNGAETINGILRRNVVQIIKLLKQKIFAKSPTTKFSLAKSKEFNLFRKNIIKTETMNKTNHSSEENRSNSSDLKSTKSFDSRHFLSGHIYFKNDKIRRVRRYYRYYQFGYSVFVLIVLVFAFASLLQNYLHLLYIPRSPLNSVIIFALFLMTFTFFVAFCGLIIIVGVEQLQQQEVALPNERIIQRIFEQSTRPFDIQTADENFSMSG